MIRRLTLTLLPLIAVATLTAGLAGCEIYPSGCVRLEPWEEPFPVAWNPDTLAVHWNPPPPDPRGLTFVGVKGDRRHVPIWHGPAHFTGWAEYASAINCYESNGAYAG
jgi:hypothetical protein